MRVAIKSFVLTLFLWLAGVLLTPWAQEPAKAPTLVAGTNEVLAVIVNQSNPIDRVTMDELRSICTARRRHWPHGGKITLALREPGQMERDFIVRQLCNTTEAQFTRQFIAASFGGEIQAEPKLLTSSFGVRRFVFHVPGSIGFVRLADVDPSIKVLQIDGHRPGEPGYPLVFEPPAQQATSH